MNILNHVVGTITFLASSIFYAFGCVIWVVAQPVLLINDIKNCVLSR